VRQLTLTITCILVAALVGVVVYTTGVGNLGDVVTSTVSVAVAPDSTANVTLTGDGIQMSGQDTGTCSAVRFPSS
jgi:hypothetical protein